MSVLPATLPRSLTRTFARTFTRVPPLAVDLLIVAIAEASLMWGVVQSQAMNEASGIAPWPWWIWPAVALLPLPLLWRRRAPYAALLLSGLGMVALSIVDNLAVTYNHSSEFLLLVGMATVAYYCTGWQFWSAAIISVGCNFVAVTESIGKSSVSALVVAMAFVAGRLAAQQRDLARLMSGRAQAAEQTAEARAAQAAAEERTRIARDMHDILAHAVSLMIVQAEAGAAVLRQDQDKAERAFDAVADGGREALTQLRRMLGVLREGDALALSPQPTLSELPRLVETVRAAKVDVRLVAAGVPRPLPRDIEVAMYRTAQEALTNMIKHARAERAELRVDWARDEVTLRVTDDGVGPQRDVGAEASPGGRGLIGIKERMAACGGTVSAGPGPDGRGFQVLVRVPTG
jgi:signal transduction histidine kinase